MTINVERVNALISAAKTISESFPTLSELRGEIMDELTEINDECRVERQKQREADIKAQQEADAQARAEREREAEAEAETQAKAEYARGKTTPPKAEPISRAIPAAHIERKI